MRKVLALIAVLAAFTVTAQMKVQPKQPGRKPMPVQGAQQKAAANFPRISHEDAVQYYKDGRAVFVDVRSNASFKKGHIRGALSIPASQIIKRFREVPPGKIVITYCACDAEQISGRAVVDLQAHGVKKAYALKGGLDEWKAKGLPMIAGPK